MEKDREAVRDFLFTEMAILANCGMRNISYHHTSVDKFLETFDLKTYLDHQVDKFLVALTPENIIILRNYNDMQNKNENSEDNEDNEDEIFDKFLDIISDLLFPVYQEVHSDDRCGSRERCLKFIINLLDK